MGSLLNGLIAARRPQRLRRHVPDLLRLHAAGRPPRGADRRAGDVRLDARLGVARRGRPHPPADRAPDGPAGDPAALPAAPLRRQRGGPGVARRDGARGRPVRPGALAPGAADARPRPRRVRRPRRACCAAPTCWPTATGTPDAIVMATGAEVHDALAARETLQADGIGVRVVSMPCWELFDQQDQAYRDEVLPPAVTARVSIEAGTTFGWERWSATRARASASTASAPRRRARWWPASSASRPRPSSRRCAR